MQQDEAYDQSLHFNTNFDVSFKLNLHLSPWFHVKENLSFSKKLALFHLAKHTRKVGPRILRWDPEPKTLRCDPRVGL